MEHQTEVFVEQVSGIETRAEGRNIRPTNSTAVRQSFLRVWLWEFLAWALAVSCLIGASVTLTLYDHQPLRELPLKVKLTTALSILANIIEAALVMQLAACLGQIMWTRFYLGYGYLKEVLTFDEASRGPLGALKLLVTGRAGFKASIGAATCLLVLAIGPFLQEAVSYVNLTEPATVQRCEATNVLTYSPTFFNSFHSFIMSPDGWQVGGQDDQPLQMLNTDCPSGDCSFPIFSSLGICSSSLNVTDRVRKNGMCLTGEAGVCNFTLDYDPMLRVTLVDDSTLRDARMTMSVASNTSSARLIDYGDSGIINLAMVWFSEGTEYNIHAFDTVLYWCVRAYQTSVQSFILNQNVTAIWYGTEATIGPSEEYYPPWWRSRSNGTNQTTGGSRIFTPPQDQWAALNLKTPTNFTVDDYTSWGLTKWLNESFNGVEYGDDNGTTRDWAMGLLWESLWWVQGQDMGHFFESATMEMSDAFRRTCPKNISAIGTAFNVATVLEVQWVWLVYPVAVVVLTGFLLISTMMDSRQCRTMVWKANILPLVFHKLSPDLERSLPENYAEDINAMEKASRNIRVKLEREGGGWHFQGRNSRKTAGKRQACTRRPDNIE